MTEIEAVGNEELIKIRMEAIGLKTNDDDRKRLVLKRPAGKRSTYPCPFCGAKTHCHGEGEGHRCAHCVGVDPGLQFTNSAGETFRLQDGYYLVDDDYDRFT